MTSRASATTAILIVLIVVVLSLAAGGFYLFQREKTKNIELEQQIEEVSTKQRVTETKLKESEKFISDLNTKLKDAQAQIDTLNSGLQQEKTARQEALAKIEQIRGDLEQQKKSRSDLENKLTLAQGELRKTQAGLRDLESQKTDLEMKVRNLEKESQDIELGKIQVTPEVIAPSRSAVRRIPAAAPTEKVAKARATAATAGLEGKVLVINRDYNFLVINLGSKDGIEMGSVFCVYHNNKYIGDVKVEKIHDSMAATGFLSGDINKVSEGDKIVQKVK